ncbi:B-cell receptor CD22-like isoform X1 [Crotalus tigris]|uniref:B-cell receptor CD22-like isoform X1 n=2 Tax=Crotalus tigris TaxID=88082 RepID=UPI00192F1DF7|nr:B-cell receptor CD22-like isoform X1 [Crotalus tigris]XP_039181714.1 B-cell receptor CD22-like isoform X1 [Crotalus tigris]
MRCFLWLLFLPGSLGGDPLSLIPKTLSAWEGSCVLISCNIEEEYKSRPLNQVSFAWYFQPLFNKTLNDYNGKLLYNSNQTTTAVSSEFRNRVKFVGNLGRKNCSLKISQLRPSDTGDYGIRLYWRAGMLPNQQKWLGKVTITVRESPSELIEIVSTEGKENSVYQVACSIPYSCLDEPITLSIQGLEDHHVWSPETTTKLQTVQTELSFMATWEDHEKQLTCLLKTADGREIKKPFANLEVKYGPKGVKVNADPGDTVREGDKLTLECIVNSSNPVVYSYQWFKNDIPWKDWLFGSRREFDSLKETDSGSYSCQATNVIESVNSGRLTINVQYPPKVNIIMSHSPIQEKDYVSLTCSATGNPSISGYEWYKSSKPDIITAKKDLRFEGIQPRNSGTYHCVARNKIGQSNASVTLNVRYRPKDVQLFHSNHLPIKEGDKVILNCSVGSSYPSNNRYKFFGSGVDTPESWDSTRMFFAKPAQFTFYRCEACNSIGCTSSPSITLDILYGPKDVKLSREPSGLIREGNSVQLICSVRMANPQQLNYTWYKNGQLLPLNSTENVLLIQNARSVDSGIYHCVSKNIITNAESPTIKLEVNYGPRNVHLTLDQKGVTEGMDIYLRCDNDAYPTAVTYKWYWKGEEIFMEDSKILVLRKIKVAQSGDYLCKAFNSISNKESQPITISVSYSTATVMKQTLISLGVVLVLIILLGLLLYGCKKWKKTTRSDIGSTQRPGSFFVRKAKREVPLNNNCRLNEGRTGRPQDCQNEEQDGSISYARLQFSHSGLNDHTIYSRVMLPNLGLDSSESNVIYSAVKKPALHPKNDTKMDYENVMNKEEELHYSSLVNLASRPHPINVDLETDSQSEDSIQYAALRL